MRHPPTHAGFKVMAVVGLFIVAGILGLVVFVVLDTQGRL